MQEVIAGLDLGDGMLTAARVETQGEGQLTLVQAGCEEYPVDADDHAITQAVRRLWKRQHFPTSTVAVSLRSQSVALKHFQYSGVAMADVESAIRLDAEEALQTPQDKICLDWHILRNVPAEGNAGAREVEGILVAAPIAEVDRQMKILHAAGLYPVVMDVGPMAISNLFLALRGKFSPEKNACIVNLGRRIADIAIHFGDASIYPRTIISRSADWKEAGEYLAANIQDVMKYCQFKLRRTSVQQVLLCGRIPDDAAAFVQRLSAALRLPVLVWNPLRELAVGGRVDKSYSDSASGKGAILAGCLGLALRKEAA